MCDKTENNGCCVFRKSTTVETHIKFYNDVKQWGMLECCGVYGKVLPKCVLFALMVFCENSLVENDSSD